MPWLSKHQACKARSSLWSCSIWPTRLPKAGAWLRRGMACCSIWGIWAPPGTSVSNRRASEGCAMLPVTTASLTIWLGRSPIVQNQPGAKGESDTPALQTENEPCGRTAPNGLKEQGEEHSHSLQLHQRNWAPLGKENTEAQQAPKEGLENGYFGCAVLSASSNVPTPT